MSTERLIIFVPGLKCGLNLVAFHIYSWTRFWLPEIKES